MVPDGKSGGLRPWKGRLLKPGVNRRGYQQVTLCADGVKRQRKVHQLVLEAFVGSCPPGMEVMHTDNDPGNNALDNLSYGTPSQNQVHRTVSGNRKRSLSDDDVLDIRRRLEQGETLSSVADTYGVSWHSIQQIKTGRSYAWLIST